MSELYPVTHFANKIIEKSFEDKRYITLRKLQMLAYLSASEYMKDRELPATYTNVLKWGLLASMF